MTRVKLLNSGAASAHYEDNLLSLSLFGEIYDLAENNAAARLAKLYRKEGIQGLAGLNGRYFIAVDDRGNDRFHLVNDRYGFKRCHYARVNDEFICSPDFASICSREGISKQPDVQALADFIFLGFVLDERTFLEEIRLLPPASILTLSEKGISIDRYWDYSFNTGNDRQANEVEYLDKFWEIIQRAVEKRLAGRSDVILPVSGGLDSRTMAGCLVKSHYPGRISAVSYGHRECYDVVYGRRIAKRLGLNHTFFPIGSDYLKRYAEKFVKITDGTISCLNAHTMIFHEAFEGRDSLSILTGFLGDVLTGTNFDKSWESLSEEDLIWKTFEVPAGHLAGLATLARKEFYERMLDGTVNGIRKHFDSAPGADPFYKMHHLTLSQRQRRYVAFNLYGYESLATVLSPFTDNDFIEFVLGLPKEMLNGQGLYKKMIVKFLPEVASVEYNKTRLPLNASDLRKGLHWRWERLVRNPLVRATIGRKYARMNDNYLNTDQAIRTRSRDFVIKHIKNNPFLAEYFNMDRVHQMLDDHMNGKSNEYGKITALLTLALWSKMFVENEKPTFK